MASNSIRLRLHHFGISVPNLDDTVAWYRDKLGFTLAYRYATPQPPARVAFMARDGFRVEIFEVDGAEAMPSSRRELASDLRVQGLKHATFAVDDIEGVMADLKRRGVEFATDVLEIPDSGGERFAFFRDNNGILLELYQPRPEGDAARE